MSRKRVTVGQERDTRRPLIAVVGPCGSGKSSLVRALRACGYNAREVAQEHSFVPGMWQRLTAPDALVYLDVTLEVATRRGSLGPHDARWWFEQHQRLAHARALADMVIQTDTLTCVEVAARVLRILRVHASHTATVAGLAR